jgi:hypothetical protein
MKTKQIVAGIALVLLSSAALTEAAPFRRGGRYEEGKGLEADRFERKDYEAGAVAANRFEASKDNNAFNKEFKDKEFKGEAACEDEHFKAGKSEKHSRDWDEGSWEEFVDQGKSAKVVKDLDVLKEGRVNDRDNRAHVEAEGFKERGVSADYVKKDDIREGERRRGDYRGGERGERFGRRFY